VLAVAGCGGDDGDESTDDTTATTGFADCVDSGQSDCTISDDELDDLGEAFECVESEGEDC
jgi:hypothetical protein